MKGQEFVLNPVWVIHSFLVAQEGMALPKPDTYWHFYSYQAQQEFTSSSLPDCSLAYLYKLRHRRHRNIVITRMACL